MGSSRVHVETITYALAHECGFEGDADFELDPEFDLETFYGTCPGCKAQLTTSVRDV